MAGAADQKATFKVCLNCSNAAGLRRRRCDCDGDMFRAPTCEEVSARDKQIEKLNAMVRAYNAEPTPCV